MKIVLSNQVGSHHHNVAIRCPHCGHNGSFLAFAQDYYSSPQRQIIFGLRKCPNLSCSGLIFFTHIVDSNTLETFPSDVIPFDTERIPLNILNAFSEAIICHSNKCFIASAIMIRKTLEEICAHEHCKGNTLYARLLELCNKIMIPKELKEGMTDLRLLGNDAAHIEANTFGQVGQQEIEISIEFTKEILKATYQYENLLSRLRALKKEKEQNNIPQAGT